MLTSENTVIAYSAPTLLAVFDVDTMTYLGDRQSFTVFAAFLLIADQVYYSQY